MEAQPERLLRGQPMPWVAKHLLLPAGWLRPRGQPGHSTHRRAYDSDLVCVRLCRTADRSCDLQAVSDKVTPSAVRLFLTGKEDTHSQTDCLIVLQPKSKDNTFTRGEVLPASASMCVTPQATNTRCIQRYSRNQKLGIMEAASVLKLN